MNDQEMQTLVEELILTKNDKAIFLEALATVKEAAYMKDIAKIVTKLKNNLAERFYKPLEVILNNAKTPSELSTFVVTVEQLVNKLPVVSITICYEPTRKQTEQLSIRLRSTTKQPLITDYSINPDTVGIKINYNGKIYKKSLEEQLT